MADEVDSKSIGSNTVRVQVPRPALLGRGEIAENSGLFRILAIFSFVTLVKTLHIKNRLL